MLLDWSIQVCQHYQPKLATKLFWQVLLALLIGFYLKIKTKGKLLWLLIGWTVFLQPLWLPMQCVMTVIWKWFYSFNPPHSLGSLSGVFSVCISKYWNKLHVGNPSNIVVFHRSWCNLKEGILCNLDILCAPQQTDERCGGSKYDQKSLEITAWTGTKGTRPIMANSGEEKSRKQSRNCQQQKQELLRSQEIENRDREVSTMFIADYMVKTET